VGSRDGVNLEVDTSSSPEFELLPAGNPQPTGSGNPQRPAATPDLHRPSTGNLPALDQSGGCSTSKSINREGACDG
jgi:hypothetical protein